MNSRLSSLRAAALLAPALLSACAQSAGVLEDEAAPEALGSASQAIIDGELADEAVYAAVGALVYYLPEVGVLDTFCSGTLVSPRAITTARHCTPSIDLALEFGLTPAFAIGPNAFEPVAVIPITGYVDAPAAPGHEKGLLLDGGRDVAVAYLESAPAGVTPVKLGLFDDKMLGSRFDIAGFGISDTSFFYGQKFAGTVTARALHGRWYELLFGDYATFREWYFTDSSATQPSEAEAKEWWKIYKLENKYELLAGGLPGESVACFGDSGGPLLRGTTPQTLTTYGVSFAVEATSSTVCGLGGSYLVFNRKMLDFVEDAL